MRGVEALIQEPIKCVSIASIQRVKPGPATESLSGLR